MLFLNFRQWKTLKRTTYAWKKKMVPWFASSASCPSDCDVITRLDDVIIMFWWRHNWKKKQCALILRHQQAPPVAMAMSFVLCFDDVTRQCPLQIALTSFVLDKRNLQFWSSFYVLSYKDVALNSSVVFYKVIRVLKKNMRTQMNHFIMPPPRVCE